MCYVLQVHRKHRRRVGVSQQSMSGHGFFLKKEKKRVKQLFFCREQEGLATCGVSSSLEREEGRTNSYALWCGISTSFRSAKRETAQPPVVRWACLVHQGFIGKKEWRDCFYRNPLVLADFYLLRTKSYNPLLISSRWRRCWKVRGT